MMHVERIVFDQVFDVSRRGKFSFSSGQLRAYGITLPGRKVPAPGDVLTIGFRKAWDWSTVLAVYDHAKETPTVKKRSRVLAWGQFELAIWFVIGAIGATAKFGGAGLAGAVAVGLAAIAIRKVWLESRRLCKDSGSSA